ncbi:MULTISPECIES: hypothetical protein [Acinetobacter]|uniref:hypothetical protein n=1 Tax=Acinetobacter TaxID=469 RepID=UPI00019ADC69|nr:MULTISPECIES: hypothetical protein [Acinetobacter]EEH70377.1 hypothetical protein HMPREF0023_0083 [Acinetobacter sp. ATCC 27244]MCU4387354.1 hypothetical protein [Acinetobacter haemolyticus]NAR58532.1 hypothetical protein [Acinetobacter haemolyticus]NAR61520.1 hypothetical protein [Acinetobacter haemolyticus]NAR68241.1 hypothetical protein [Acinetobacter haemolyticus]
MQKLKPASLVALIIGIVIVVVGAYLLNQHQQRQTDLQLAQLALEQSKVQNQTTDIAQAASEPIEEGLSGIEGLTEDRANQTAHLEVSPDEVAGALAAVENAKATQKAAAAERLSYEVDAKYHDGKTLSSKLSRYGLQPMKSAPADLRATVPDIDQMLATHLMEVWGRSSPDQVAKRLDGWSEQGNTITYRTAWDSDRYQCTWYVVQWNKDTDELLNEGYKPCFGR